MKTFNLTVVVWKEKEGYVSKNPELGITSCGDNISEATANLKEAIELYLENAQLLGILEDIKEGLSSKEKFTSYIEVAYA